MYTVSIIKGEKRKEILQKSLKNMEHKIPNISGRIVIKPNFLSANTLLASTTPETLEVVVQFFRNKFPNNEIYIAEGSHVSAEFFEKYHIRELAEKYNAKLFSIDCDEKSWHTIQFDDLVSKKCDVRISNLYYNADYIVSLTVPKTHANIGVSLSMKNLVGTLHPEDRPKFHGLSENVPQNIKDRYKRRVYDRDDKLGFYLMKARNMLPVTEKSAEYIKLGGEIVRKNLYNLYTNMKPNFCIIDGFNGMQGNGPWHGDNAHLKTVIIGDNCVATDLVACQIMGQPLQDIGYINYIDDISTYKDNIELLGDTIDKVKKDLKPHKFEPYL